MSSDVQSSGRAADEAADWFARLNGTSISTEELVAFRAWRKDPANGAAYGKLEKIWQGSKTLGRDPDIVQLLDRARKRNRRPRISTPWVRTGLGVGMGGLALAAVGWALIAAVQQGRTYRTAVGEQSTIALEDGTRVRLDTDSQISVRYTGQRRSIGLQRGQAFFDVVHQADRPLDVTVGQTVIRDLGTRFDVRRDDGSVRITVVEGTVAVGPGAKPPSWTLSAGQEMVAGARVQAPHPVDTAKAVGWTTGRLTFEEKPLAEVIAEMNRYGQHRLILDDAAVGAVKVNGAFDSVDTTAFVSAITRLYDLSAKVQPDGSIRLSAANADHHG